MLTKNKYRFITLNKEFLLASFLTLSLMSENKSFAAGHHKPYFPLGTFSGTITTPAGTINAIASILKLEHRKRHYEANLELYPISGVGKTHEASIKYSSSLLGHHRHFRIKSDLIGNDEIELRVTSKKRQEDHLDQTNFEICADGSYETQSHTNAPARKKDIHVCIGSQKFEFIIKDGNLILQEAHFEREAGFERAISSEITLEEAMGRARFKDFNVQQEADQLRQIEEKEHIARAGVLPTFSLSSLLALSQFNISPFSMSMFGMYVPFIFPSNWYALRQAKETFIAEEALLRSIQGNEMLSVQAQYYGINHNLIVLEKRYDLLRAFDAFEQELALPNELGVSKIDGLTLIKTKKMKLALEIRDLEKILRQNLAQFAQTIGFNPLNKNAMSIAPIQLVDLSTVNQIDPIDLSNAALNKSFELTTLEHLLKAAKDQEIGQRWSMFNQSMLLTFSFDYRAKLRLAQQIQDQILKKTDYLKLTFETRSNEISTQVEAALRNQSDINELVVTTQGLLNDLQKIQNHSLEAVAQRIQILEDLNSYEIRGLDNQHNVMVALAGRDRLLLQSYYEPLSQPVKHTDPSMVRTAPPVKQHLN